MNVLNKDLLGYQLNGLQDQSAFLRINCWSPATPVPPWLLVSREPYRAPYAGIS
jgi:hypothetical protein